MSVKNMEYYMGLNYTTEIRKIPEEGGGGYVAEIPELGRMATTGWGETADAALVSLEECKRMNFALWLSEGVEIPEPVNAYSGKMLLRIPKSLHKSIAELAAREGMSINACAGSLLSKAIIPGYYETLAAQWASKSKSV